MTYSNPRLTATFADWPCGKHHVSCTFKVETSKKGTRVSKQTFGKPKYSTYGGPACIVDGDDNKTYILQHIPMWPGVKVWTHDFMSQEAIFQRNDPERYEALMALIAQAK